jgi:lipopolysaccharide assembly outer membrane protein LptD (OstA)
MIRLAFVTLLVVLACPFVFAQQTNPVDRKVANPMTDTPNVNPLNNDQPVQRRPSTPNGVQGTVTDELNVESTRQSVSGPQNARVFLYEGNVDARIGTYRLQADKVTVPCP